MTFLVYFLFSSQRVARYNAATSSLCLLKELPMRLSRSCVIVVLALFISVVWSGRAAGDEKLNQRLENLDKSIEELRAFLKIPGISAAVVKDQKLIWAKGFGQADRERVVAATPETPYRIASLTKTFASTLLLQLV